MLPDFFKVTLPFAGAAIGAVSGAFFKAWFDSFTERWRLRSKEKQTKWRPLLEGTTKLRARLEDLSAIYIKTDADGFSKTGLSADFRELYMLSPEPVNLENSDANGPRANASAVQRLRTRMAHHLTYAVSSLYFTGAYLGHAERLSRALRERSLILKKRSRIEIMSLLSDVRSALQGKSGAGIPWEEQESVAEMVWSANDSVISYSEFRKRLLELPGWEQFMGLFRFFITFEAKIKYEVADSINALGKLEDRLISLTRR
jgi:hypothetical protein